MKAQTLETIIESNKKALLSETKSTAGDKHETGRAMLQLEMEKAGQQLASIRQMEETIAKIDASKEVSVSCLGAIVKTNQTSYFLSISAGKILVEGNHYFAISVSTPIGKLLLGKGKGDRVYFNGNEIVIEDIV